MKTFIAITFAFMALAFFVLSGGSDFDPPQRPVAESAPLKRPEVSRAQVDLMKVSLTREAQTPRLQPVRAVMTGPRPAPVKGFVLLDDQGRPVAASGQQTTQQPGQQPAPQTAAATTAAASLPVIDQREVAAERVNLRQGPGTDHAVVGKLARGAAVDILEDPGQGWVRLRTADGSLTGWTADYLLIPGT